MRIAAVSKVLPGYRYDQRELTDLLRQMWRTKADDRTLNRLHKFHESVQVGQRNLALPKEAYEKLDSFTAANQAFVETGANLGRLALEKALQEADLSPQDIDAIFFTTVTGLAVPTIDARIVNSLRLRRDVKRIPLFGLGCVAGVAGIARMHDYLTAYPRHVAALISVELCSLTIQSTDFSAANLIASGLFGDGAAAVIGMGGDCVERARTKRPEVLRSKSFFYYDSEDVMGWKIGTSGFQIVLSADVPRFVADYLPEDLSQFLAESGLRCADIASWVCHSGGPKVLEAMEKALGVNHAALDLTWRSLREVGNLSSASVLFVLSDTIEQRPGSDGEYGVMIAMGPGFCSELVLFRW